ncbi:hypothetical protein MTO96_019636 [Rhipicephalus appendiculatus]
MDTSQRILRSMSRQATAGKPRSSERAILPKKVAKKGRCKQAEPFVKPQPCKQGRSTDSTSQDPKPKASGSTEALPAITGGKGTFKRKTQLKKLVDALAAKEACDDMYQSQPSSHNIPDYFFEEESYRVAVLDAEEAEHAALIVFLLRRLSEQVSGQLRHSEEVYVGAMPTMYPAASLSLLRSESGATVPKHQCLAEVGSDEVNICKETAMEETSLGTARDHRPNISSPHGASATIGRSTCDCQTRCTVLVSLKSTQAEIRPKVCSIGVQTEGSNQNVGASGCDE